MVRQRKQESQVRKRHLPMTLGGRQMLNLRAAGEGDQRTIVGYGAVFYNADDPGTEYWLWDDFVERIMPGAFDRALQEDDVRSAFNHNMDLILGRTTAGTLKLSVDAIGLQYEVTPPASRADVVEAIERGDVTGSSFMFIPTSVSWRTEKIDKTYIDIREINEVELWEVGPVAFPAYDSTTSELRVAAGDAAADRDERELRTRDVAKRAARRRAAINARTRLLEIEHGH